jgi:hypothetical protein
MGIHILQGYCPCGYVPEKMPMGSIYRLVDQIDYFPIFCRTCGELYSSNINDKPPMCLKCYSSDINLYGSLTLTGELIEIDIDKEFEESYEILSFLCEGEFTLDKEQEKKDFILKQEQSRREETNPIFSHYNYCPKCNEYRLEFFYNETVYFEDELLSLFPTLDI